MSGNTFLLLHEQTVAPNSNIINFLCKINFEETNNIVSILGTSEKDPKISGPFWSLIIRWKLGEGTTIFCSKPL